MGVSDDELQALYAGARVVLVPSRAEGLGLLPLEAFADGAPVVASDIGPLRAVSGGLALHVSPDDDDSCCKAVARLIAHSGDAHARRHPRRGFHLGRYHSAAQGGGVVARLRCAAHRDATRPLNSLWNRSVENRSALARHAATEGTVPCSKARTAWAIA